MSSDPVSLVIEDGRHQPRPVVQAPEETEGPVSAQRDPGLEGLPGGGHPPALASQDPALRNIWSPTQGWPSAHLRFPVSFLPALVSCHPSRVTQPMKSLLFLQNAKFCSGLALHAFPALFGHRSLARVESGLSGCRCLLENCHVFQALPTILLNPGSGSRNTCLMWLAG